MITITQLSVQALSFMWRSFVAGMAAFGLLVALVGPTRSDTTMIFWGVGMFFVAVKMAFLWLKSVVTHRLALRAIRKLGGLQTHDAETLAIAPAGARAV